MAEIIWTNEAERWLKDIYEYIAEDNPDAATEVVSGIYQKVQQLLSFPQSGYIYQGEQDGDIRILLYGHYRIAYQQRGKKQIIVLGVFHGALDIDRYL